MRLNRGYDGIGHCQGHVARPGPHGSPCSQHRCSREMPGPRHHEHATACVLVSVGGRPGKKRGIVRRRSKPQAHPRSQRISRGMPMSATTTSPARAAAGYTTRPSSWSRERHCHIGFDRVCREPARVAVNACGHIDRDQVGAARIRCPAPAQVADRAGATPAPVPKSASTTTAASDSSLASGACGGHLPGNAAGHRLFGSRGGLTGKRSGGRIAITRTLRPAACRRRAATQPSPPLLPEPARMTTLPSGTRSATS